MADENPVVPNGIVLSEETLEIKVGESATVQLALSPADAERDGSFDVAHDETVEVTIEPSEKEGQDLAVTVKGLEASTSMVEVTYTSGETVLTAELLVNINVSEQEVDANEPEIVAAEEEPKPADEAEPEATGDLPEAEETATEEPKVVEEEQTEPEGEVSTEAMTEGETESTAPSTEPAREESAPEQVSEEEQADPDAAPLSGEAVEEEPTPEQGGETQESTEPVETEADPQTPPPDEGSPEPEEVEEPASEVAEPAAEVKPVIKAETIVVVGGDELDGDVLKLVRGDQVSFSVRVEPEEANQTIVFGFDSQFPFAQCNMVQEDGGNRLTMTALSAGSVNLIINSVSNPQLEKSIQIRIAEKMTQEVLKSAEEHQEHTKKVVSMIIEQELNTYAEKMAPNVPHSDEEGARLQVLLYRAFQKVLRTEGTDFTGEMDKLLEFVHQHRKTLFSEYNAFRHMDAVALSPNDRLSFTRLLNAFITLADPATRQITVKQVDLNKTMELFGDQRAHQRVMQYFGQIN